MRTQTETCLWGFDSFDGLLVKITVRKDAQFQLQAAVSWLHTEASLDHALSPLSLCLETR